MTVNPCRLELFGGCCRYLPVVLAWLIGFSGDSTADERVEFFETKIRPALIEHCYECHSNVGGKSEGGLLVDSRPALQRGGESGNAITAGRPDDSLLIEAIRYESFEMPPDKRLDAGTIRLFEEWIRMGAVDPRDEETMSPVTDSIDIEEARQFWAFQPRKKVGIPDPGADWGSSPIDRFILAKLQEKQLEPAAEADRATWLRRVTFDLVGLPPTVDELDEFLADQRTDAFERVVDRLLTSPHYGERWGRYWLDLARYADSNGADENHTYPEAWRYRDYVVSAYNDDKPYDQMVLQQLAGDLMPAETESERRENLTATGFLVLGPKMLAEQDKEKLVADIVDEQLDTVGKVFLGLTLGCARCHDHKFDPITARDYYSLAGIFHSTRSMEHLNHVSQWNERELPDHIRQKKIDEIRVTLEAAKAESEQVAEVMRLAEFDRQLELLRQLMLNEIDDPMARQQVPAGDDSSIADLSIDDSANDVNPQKALRPLVEFLASDHDVLDVWKRLSVLPVERFADEAHRVWQELDAASGAPTSAEVARRFGSVLALHTAPQTPLELVENYLSAFRKCRSDVHNEGHDKPLRLALFGKRSVFDAGREPALYLSQTQKARLGEVNQRVVELSDAMPVLDKVMAAEESTIKLVSLHVRGNHMQLSGEPLPRDVPEVLESAPDSAQFPSDASGRLELAQWLVRPDHPLTARVMVNRIWQGHFGHGLVRSPSNFGMRGQEPTHPRLLDWLAEEFIRGDWSIKRIHRIIVLSATYRMTCLADHQAELADPENLYLSHFPRRRLELEPIRDALLALTGQLDKRLGGRAKLAADARYEESGVGKTVFDAPRRTIYLPVNRAALNAVFSTFDYVDPAVSLEQRPSTIVPHQTLFLMNHPMARDAGRHLAERLMFVADDDEDRIEYAYKSMFSRQPTPEERRVAERFISTQIEDYGDASGTETESKLTAWISYCRALILTSEFLYVD